MKLLCQHHLLFTASIETTENDPVGSLEDTIRISQCPRISQDKDKTTNSIDYQERKLDPCPRPLPANNFSLKGCMGSGALGPTDAV